MRIAIALLLASFMLAFGCLGLGPQPLPDDNDTPPAPPDGGGNACTKEAKLCPDGSYVGRNAANNCAFDPCPAAGGDMPPPPPSD